MNQLEQKYVDEINAYLSTPVINRDIEKGAMLMLKGNRNQTLYKNVIRRTWHEKVDYELTKILESHNVRFVKTATSKEIISDLEIKALEISKKPVIGGKRPDHDSLPENIKSIPDKNSEKYHLMRSVHEKLKLFNGENYDAESRKPLLSQLLQLDNEIITDWATYDNFAANKSQAENLQPGSHKLDVKEVQKYRTALSRAVNEIPEKIAKGKTDEAATQLSKAQSCYDLLKADGQNFTPAMLDKMKSVTINL